MGISQLDAFIEDVQTYGFEDTIRLYYSTYRAIVLRNDDPEERGRIQISCPEVGHSENEPVDVWVSPATDVTGPGMGWFNPPVVNSFVRVSFDRGNPSMPKLYWGGWFTTPDTASPLPKEFGYSGGKPQRRGFRSRAGHVLLFNDEPGKESVRIIWHKIPPGSAAATDPDAVSDSIQAGDDIAILSFDSDGSVQIRNSLGSLITLDTTNKQILLQDSNGNLVSMSSAGIAMMDKASPASSIHMNGKGDITLIASKNINFMAPNINLKSAGVFLGDGAPFSATIFDILNAWLASHTHTGVTPGPGASGPPAAPVPPAAKSSAVKLK